MGNLSRTPLIGGAEKQIILSPPSERVEARFIGNTDRFLGLLVQK
jgi:hypothetical protein